LCCSGAQKQILQSTLVVHELGAPSLIGRQSKRD
jgi:hypothetical protein